LQAFNLHDLQNKAHFLFQKCYVFIFELTAARTGSIHIRNCHLISLQSTSQDSHAETRNLSSGFQ